MTATHNQARRTKRPAKTSRHLRLPRLGWWWATIPVALIAAARTWPVQSAILGVVLVSTLITWAIGPAWAVPLLNRIGTITIRQASLPAQGQRTLRAFLAMDHTRFEYAIADLARKHRDVRDAVRVGQANDRGMDVLVHLTDGRRILIQCKHHELGNNVGSPVIQTVNGVYRDIHHCHQAAIVTTASFTPAAAETNAMLPQQIRLVDGNALVQWANGGSPPWQ
jgi:restriction system protein